ncbi:hypothetical protein D3C81_1872410 [compost metagenome]
MPFKLLLHLPVKLVRIQSAAVVLDPQLKRISGTQRFNPNMTWLIHVLEPVQN